MVSSILCAAFLSLGITNADLACKHIDDILAASKMWKVPPLIIAAQIYRETRWNPKIIGANGECGLMQILPRHTKGKKWTRVYTCKDLQNSKLAIYAGAEGLHIWLRVYKRDLKKALCGYNKGYQCKKKKLYLSGMKYSTSVLKIAKKYQRTYWIAKWKAKKKFEKVHSHKR